MNITPFGRVELDPMRVPVSSVGARTAEAPHFERVLQDATRAQQPEPRKETAATPSTPAPAEEQAGAAPEREQDADATPAAPSAAAGANGSEAAAAIAPQAAPVAAAPAQTSNTAEEGEPVERIETGKPAGSPASFALEDRWTELLPKTDTGRPVAVALPVAVAAAPAPANAKVEGSGAAGLQEVAGSTKAKEAGPASFRTMSPQTLALAEQARDSVFKQIAFRLTPERGEMRMLLDPPELGQLDLRLVVDKQGAVSLAILAERPEVAATLDKHMHALQQTLADQGLVVAHAHVQQQDRQPHHAPQREDADSVSAGAETEMELVTGGAFSGRGFSSAEGLDFWV